MEELSIAVVKRQLAPSPFASPVLKHPCTIRKDTNDDIEGEQHSDTGGCGQAPPTTSHHLNVHPSPSSAGDNDANSSYDDVAQPLSLADLCTMNSDLTGIATSATTCTEYFNMMGLDDPERDVITDDRTTTKDGNSGNHHHHHHRHHNQPLHSTAAHPGSGHLSHWQQTLLTPVHLTRSDSQTQNQLISQQQQQQQQSQDIQPRAHPPSLVSASSRSGLDSGVGGSVGAELQNIIGLSSMVLSGGPQNSVKSGNSPSTTTTSCFTSSSTSSSAAVTASDSAAVQSWSKGGHHLKYSSPLLSTISERGFSLPNSCQQQQQQFAAQMAQEADSGVASPASHHHITNNNFLEIPINDRHNSAAATTTTTTVSSSTVSSSVSALHSNIHRIPGHPNLVYSRMPQSSSSSVPIASLPGSDTPTSLPCMATPTSCSNSSSGVGSIHTTPHRYSALGSKVTGGTESSSSTSVLSEELLKKKEYIKSRLQFKSMSTQDLDIFVITVSFSSRSDEGKLHCATGSKGSVLLQQKIQVSLLYLLKSAWIPEEQ